jgi:KaiC/GvpD/RAD55 family RecA-like ATPase
MYDLSAVFRLDALADLGPGATVLVADTDGTDTATWVYDALSRGLDAGDGAVVVSASASADAVLDRLGVPADPQSLCVVDCAGDERSSRLREDGVFVYSVESPDDLTGIGIALSACFDRLDAAGYDRGRIGFVSLSAMLDATGDQATFKFAHVVSSRLGAAGYLGLFGLGQPHSLESRRILSEAADWTVELKRSQDGTAGRLWERQTEAEWHPIARLNR